jgi:hypothetical protein
MKTSKWILTGLLLAGTLVGGSLPVNAGDITVKDTLDFAGYCHMKFPPISDASLSSDQPVLDEAAGNVIDFYGSCDHDPLGPDEVQAQRAKIADTE